MVPARFQSQIDEWLTPKRLASLPTPPANSMMSSIVMRERWQRQRLPSSGKTLASPTRHFEAPCDDAGMKAGIDAPARLRPDPRIGKAIRMRREFLRKTQQIVADAAGISRSHVSNIERGEDGWSAAALAKIAEELNLSLDGLLNSPAAGTPGTFTITVTEEELGAVIGIRGLPPEERAPIVKTLLRASQAPKQS